MNIDKTRTDFLRDLTALNNNSLRSKINIQPILAQCFAIISD